MAASEEDAWHYFSLKSFEKIANLFGVGADCSPSDHERILACTRCGCLTDLMEILT